MYPRINYSMKISRLQAIALLLIKYAKLDDYDCYAINSWDFDDRFLCLPAHTEMVHKLSLNCAIIVKRGLGSPTFSLISFESSEYDLNRLMASIAQGVVRESDSEYQYHVWIDRCPKTITHNLNNPGKAACI